MGTAPLAFVLSPVHPLLLVFDEEEEVNAVRDLPTEPVPVDHPNVEAL